MGKIQDGRQRPFWKQVNKKSDDHNHVICLSWGVEPISGFKMIILGFKAPKFDN